MSNGSVLQLQRAAFAALSKCKGEANASSYDLAPNMTSLIINATMNATFNATVNATNASVMMPSCMPNNAMQPTPTPAAIGDHSKVIARIFYIVVLLIGTVGNLLTCYIIITRRFMRRTIHIYTFNLAVADLIVLLFYVPVEIVRNENDLQWTMGKGMCSLNNFAAPTSIGASICTLVAITLDRHRGVTKPFLWRADDSRRALKYMIPAIWLIALVSSAPLFFVAKVIHRNNGTYCVENFGNEQAMLVYWITMFCLQVPVPLCIIVAANTHMIWVMARIMGNSQEMVVEEHEEEQQHHKQHKRMIRMVVLLVFVYAVCTSPQHIVFFWFVYGDLEQHREMSMVVFKAANLLVIVQSAINPVIYGTGRSDFKRAFKSIFYCKKIRKYILPVIGGETSKVKLIATKENGRQFGSHTMIADFPTMLHSGFEDGSSVNPMAAMPIVDSLKRTNKRNVTDTPPLRRNTSREETRRESDTNGPKRPKKLSRTEDQKRSSFANGRKLSNVPPDDKTMAYHNEQKRISRQHTTMLPTCLDFNMDGLENLINSPETII
eukprot:gene7799-8645_t